MMNFIRQRLRSGMWVVIILFVGGLFLMGGKSVGPTWLAHMLPVSILVKVPSWARSAGILMRVGDYNVKVDEYKRIMENTMSLARIRYKDNFDKMDIDFGQQTEESLVQYALLLQEADRHGIYVSKADIDKGIREFPQWVPTEIESRVMPYGYYDYAKTQGGVFNPNLYKYYLSSLGKITPEQFSEEVEKGLRIARLKAMLNESALATDLEIQQEYAKQNEKAKIKAIDFRYTDFASKVEIDEAELNAFFQENILNYKIGDKVNIRFIKIDPKIFEANIDITDRQIENYYEVHREEDYHEPEKVKGQHIYVKADENTPAEDKAKAKAHAEKILEEARKPDVEFSPALAEKFNEDPFEVEHQELGTFERGRMVKPFEDAVFALSTGEISDVIETQFGYHVARVQSKSPEKTRLLPEVRGEIIQKLKEEDALVEAKQRAEDIKYTVLSEDSLQAAVDTNPELNLRIQETGFFAKNEQIPNIGPAYLYSVLADKAFEMKVDAISEPIEVELYGGRVAGHFIFKVIGKEAGGLPELDDVRGKVVTNFRNEKAKGLAMEEAKKVMAAKDAEEDLDKLAEKSDLKVSESELFALATSGYISAKPTAINSKTVMPKAFSMDIGEIAGPFDGINSAYIIQLVEREEPDYKKLEEGEVTKKSLRDQIVRQKRQKIYDEWYQKVKETAVITSFFPTTS
ncbi:peptidyl-prolyl cis-trans isomerase [Candidatus Poribacteria bacterium]